MNAVDLIESFSEFKELKNIDRETAVSILEEVFRGMLERKYGSEENFDVIVNTEKGDLELWWNRTIVKDGEVEDENSEIAYSEAILIEPDFEIGEEVSEEVHLADFGRRAILSLRQNLVAKILELEKGNIFEKYTARIGDIVTGEVYQIWKKETLILDDDGNELILPKTEQIPFDYFKKGDTVRAVVLGVEMRNNNPLII